MLKNKLNEIDSEAWQPSAQFAVLHKRAAIINSIRNFFLKRNFLEVETPLMCQTSVTDPFIQSIPVRYQRSLKDTETQFYLQTSPEYAMKRLLAAGSGAIFQMSKVFRQGEVGRYHNPEFTMLEWYRPGFDHHTLMDEMDELLQYVLQTPKAERKSYAELFKFYLAIDPHSATIEELKSCALANHLAIACNIREKDTWLNLLMTHLIEPQLNGAHPYFIYDYPESQAALSRIQTGNPPLAARFEVYIQGIELANGFYELQHAQEQRERFQQNLEKREKQGLQKIALDEKFLAALEYGLPDCSGVALGIDRLIMIATGSEHIADVLSFDITRV